MHEHPKTATSWGLPKVVKFSENTDVELVHGNMCQFGMVTSYRGEVGLVEKATTFMTNSPEVSARLNRRCSKQHKEEHLHIPIWGARAREAQV